VISILTVSRACRTEASTSAISSCRLTRRLRSSCKIRTDSAYNLLGTVSRSSNKDYLSLVGPTKQTIIYFLGFACAWRQSQSLKQSLSYKQWTISKEYPHIFTEGHCHKPSEQNFIKSVATFMSSSWNGCIWVQTGSRPYANLNTDGCSEIVAVQRQAKLYNELHLGSLGERSLTITKP
jgi:hypothetical protein